MSSISGAVIRFIKIPLIIYAETACADATDDVHFMKFYPPYLTYGPG